MGARAARRQPAPAGGTVRGLVRDGERLAAVGPHRAAGPRRGGGGRAMLGGADPEVLRDLVAEQNDATLAQSADRLAERAGAGASTRARSAVCCCGLICRGKKTLHATGQDRPTSPPRVTRGAGDARRRRTPTVDLPRRERPRHPHDSRPCPGAARPAGGGAPSRRALATANHPRRDRPRRHGRRHGGRRGHQHRGLCRLHRAGAGARPKARPGAVLVMDNLAPHKAAAARGRSIQPVSRAAICRPTRPTSTRSSRVEAPGRLTATS